MTLRSTFLALAFAGALAACGQSGAGAPQNAADATNATQTAAAAPASCDSPAQPIALGSTTQSQLAATRQPYPANATYYCIDVPAGTRNVSIQLSGLSADLDVYVGHGAISTVQGVDISAGQNYQWKSNAYQNVDENVQIPNPQPGIYYIEIVSFEGNGSPFTLNVR